MRAVVVRSLGGPGKIEVIETPTPVPDPHEVLVRVVAAPLHPADFQSTSGMYVQFGAAAEADQYGVGIDVAGIVEAVGADVSTVAVGQPVIGLQERLDQRTACQAEYVVLEEWAVAPAPKDVPWSEAAGLPLNGVTAWQALDALAVPPTGWVLITGAAGAVGRLAVQLATLRGRRVLAQARESDENALRELGAVEFVSREESLGPAVRALVPGGVDGVLDAATMGVAAMDAVAHGGSYVSLLNSAPQQRRGITSINWAYRTDRAQLGLVSALSASGALSVAVAETIPLDDARSAHERNAAGGARRGLLVLTP
ncbi:NADP-dependent oxidoreductase [Amycolatopsis pithecellobii]|uniref:Zinc-binding dehydrogenase n=1 Tax=Amycolatopsis pithecellobii TaxID=664692 RepID=A0A6N7Z206_9PSEU|nr:NADP-dependent oxidoreductase [Amycolatopsis pithecellobii]MTD52606.1 zinc-binding dehydrogenase [Amycolatopsis pithecellobii]